MKKIFAIAFFVCISVFAYAQTYQATVYLDAGELVLSGSADLNANSVLLLVSAGSGNTFSSTAGTLEAGSYTIGGDLNGSDVILGAQMFNTNGGTNETLNTFNISLASSPIVGNDLELIWFNGGSGVTVSGNQITLATGEAYGIYNPQGGNPDPGTNGGTNWLVPANSSSIQLNFYTSNSDGGGSQEPSEGYASYTVIAVPEPSTLALMAVSGFGLLGYCLRARRRSSAC